MSDIFAEKFAALKKEKRHAFMPFVVAGDPDFKTSLKIGTKLAENADFLEIGFPYSDPLADGTVIQAADERALDGGMTAKKVFKLVRGIKRKTGIPITVLAYANIVFQYGIDKFYNDCRKFGADGVLIPDVPAEESYPFVRAAKRNGVCPIFLVAQTTTPARLKKILKHAEGYLYLISVLGVTGKRKTFGRETALFIKKTRRLTGMPLAVGFGVSAPEQAGIFYRAGADGVIVGSAIVDLIPRVSRKKVVNFARKFIDAGKNMRG